MFPGQRDPLLQLVTREVTQLLAKEASVDHQLEGAEVWTEGYTVNLKYLGRHIQVAVRERGRASVGLPHQS
jgi:hypothetical protein